MSEGFQPPKRSWPRKFGDAFRGWAVSVRGQSSFVVHFLAAISVVAAAIALRATLIEWCVLTLCIAIVLAAETFNTALESMAKAVDDQSNDHLRNALDISSAAVLVAAIGAAISGSTILLARLGSLINWW